MELVLKTLLKIKTLESLSTILVNLEIKYLSLNLRGLSFVFHQILCASRRGTIKLWKNHIDLDFVES